MQLWVQCSSECSATLHAAPPCVHCSSSCITACSTAQLRVQCSCGRSRTAAAHTAQMMSIPAVHALQCCRSDAALLLLCSGGLRVCGAHAGGWTEMTPRCRYSQPHTPPLLLQLPPPPPCMCCTCAVPTHAPVCPTALSCTLKVCSKEGAAAPPTSLRSLQSCCISCADPMRVWWAQGGRGDPT